MKDKLKLLKLVRQNKVNEVDSFIQRHSKVDLNFMLAGTTLLHEAVSREMLCALIIRGANVGQKNALNQNIEAVLKQKIKQLAKEKFLSQKKGKKDAYISFQQEQKHLQKTLRMLKMIRTRVEFASEMQDKRTDLNAYTLLRAAIKTNSFKSDMSQKDFLDVMELVSRFAKRTKSYQERMNTYLQNGGFDKEKLKEKAEFVQQNALDLYMKEEGTRRVKLLYRGSINPNSKIKPLSHIGSFKAARDRLECLNQTLQEGKLSVFDEMGVDVHHMFFHIKPIFLKMKKVFRLPELGNHEFKDYKRLMFHVLLMDEQGRDVVSTLYEGKHCKKTFEIKMAEIEVPKEFGYMFYEPFEMPLQEVKKELLLGGLFKIQESNTNSVNNQNRENLCYQRMIRHFERMGYDGFIYRNGWEDVGVDSYICFRPQSVVDVMKASKEELLLPVQVDEKALLRLEEKKKIASCKKVHLTKEEQFKLFDFMMPYYYGCHASRLLMGGLKVKNFVQNMFGKKTHIKE